MLRAGHSIADRIRQTGEICFGAGPRKWWNPMARAIGVKRCDLDAYMRGDWSPEEVDQINAFLAGMLDDHIDLQLPPRGLTSYDVRSLAAQYRAPRHRPVVEKPDTQEFIQQCDASELELPEGALAGLEELLADD